MLPGFHLNPIHRDLAVVISAGFLIAVGIVAVLAMIVSQL